MKKVQKEKGEIMKDKILFLFELEKEMGDEIIWGENKNNRTTT